MRKTVFTCRVVNKAQNKRSENRNETEHKQSHTNYMCNNQAEIRDRHNPKKIVAGVTWSRDIFGRLQICNCLGQDTNSSRATEWTDPRFLGIPSSSKNPSRKIHLTSKCKENGDRDAVSNQFDKEWFEIIVSIVSEYTESVYALHVFICVRRYIYVFKEKDDLGANIARQL